MRWFVVASSLGALLVAALVLRSSASDPYEEAAASEVRATDPPANGQLLAEVERQRVELRRLRAELRALQRTVAELPATELAEKRANTDDAVGAPAPVAPTQPSLAVTTSSALAEHFAAAHASDATDRMSALRYEDEVVSFFDSHGPEGIVLDEVACGATLCRIRVEHASDEARQWLSDALGEERFGGGSFVQATAGGYASIAYVAHKGLDFRIPNVAEAR